MDSPTPTKSKRNSQNPSNKRKTVSVTCEFCHHPFQKDASKHLRSKWVACKSCNGLSSNYSKSGFTSRREFFLKHHQRVVTTDISIRGDKYFFKCRFCLSEFPIRKDSLYTKTTTACDNCVSYFRRHSKQNGGMSESEFYCFHNTIPSSIDVEATIEKFGRDPRSGPRFSSLPVIASCEFCLDKFESSLAKLSRSSRRSINCPNCLCHSTGYSSYRDKMTPREYFLNRHYTADENMIVDTQNDFGYDIRLLTLSSTSLVTASCYYCNEKFHIQFRNVVRGNRLSCKSCRKLSVSDTLMKKYGVSTVCAIPSVMEKMADPYTNRLVARILSDRYGVSFVREFEIKNYSFDFWVPSANLLIECQGDYFHDFKNNGYSGTPRDVGKATYVAKHTSHKLIHIWEHEIHIGRLSKILDYHIHGAMVPMITLEDLYQLRFAHVSHEDARKFLAQYHYLGGSSITSYAYGAYLDDELLCVAIFGGVTRNQSLGKVASGFTTVPTTGVRELKRFCVRPNVTCKNLPTYTMARFMTMFKKDFPSLSAVISFADSTVCDVGTIYKASNWHKLKDTSPSYHYLDPQTNKVIHKKTLWDWSKKMKMSESDMASKIGLIRVPEGIKSVWVKTILVSDFYPFL